MSLESVSLNPISPADQDTLQTDWAAARGVLVILQKAIKNPIVKWVIGIVITLGDDIFASLPMDATDNGSNISGAIK